MLKLLNFSCSRCLFPSDHSDHFLVNINSQRSSGDSVRLGGISGAGNALVRKLAVEGSWCYAAARHQPKLMPRDTGVPLEIRMHGRKGSERLLRRREEMLARGVPAAKANAATAAELVRWLWALGMMCREGAE